MRTREQAPVVQTTQDLVRIYSETGHEQPAQQFVQDRLLTFGIPVERVGTGGENVVGVLQGKDSTRALILFTHIDTVALGEEDKWKLGKPLGGEIIEDRLRGRGSTDMKDAVAISMHVVKSVKESGDVPCDLIFVSAVDEEINGTGAKEVAGWFNTMYPDKYDKIGIVFPEPTGLHKICTGHKGNFFLDLIISGNSGHVTQLDRKNAPANFIDFALELKTLNGRLKGKAQGGFSAPRVSISSFNTTDTPHNQTSAEVKAKLDIRTVPEYHKEALEDLEAIGRNLDLRDRMKLTVVSETFPAQSSPDSSLVQSIKSHIPSGVVEHFPAASDMGPVLARLTPSIAQRVEAVIFGPGDLQDAHQIDESVEVSQILQATILLEQIYRTFATM